MEFRTIATLDEVPINKSKAVEIDGHLLLVCNTDGQIVVIRNQCPHQEQTLDRGRIRNGYIFCPVHGMRFKLDSGEAIGNLTRIPLTLFESRVVDEEIQVRPLLASEHSS